MKKFIKHVFAFLMVAVITIPAAAQFTFFTPEGSFAIEVSLDNAPFNNRLPIYQNAITSLDVVDDQIIGGTSAKEGLSPYIFVASLSKRKLTHKQALNDIIAGQKSIQSGFCRGKDHVLYAGTIADEKKSKSGHLIKVEASEGQDISITDLGVPVEGEGIFSLTCNAEGTVLYGISYPSGIFFTFNVKSSQSKTYQKTAATKRNRHKYYEFALEAQDYLSRDLIVADNGRVYGSKPVNKIFYYDPEADSISILKEDLPLVWGRHSLGRVDAWAKAEDGTLYGGNGGDGQLFTLDPSTGKVKNLGKPIMMNRLRALAFAGDGKLYGIAGASPGYAHLFSYDANGKGFADMGNPQFPMVAPGIEQGVDWRGFQLSTLVTTDDSKYVVMGEDESLSQLMVFPVGEK